MLWRPCVHSFNSPLSPLQTVIKGLTTSDSTNTSVCPFCHAPFIRGSSGLESHMALNKECRRARASKLDDAFAQVVQQSRRHAELVQDLYDMEGSEVEESYTPRRDNLDDHDADTAIDGPHLFPIDIDLPAYLPDFIEGSSSGAGRAYDAMEEERNNSSRPSKRARTEGTGEAEASGPVEEHPSTPIATYGQTRTVWERMRDLRLGQPEQRWGGFESQDEWEYARWLMKSGVASTLC